MNGVGANGTTHHRTQDFAKYYFWVPVTKRTVPTMFEYHIITYCICIHPFPIRPYFGVLRIYK